MPIHPRNSLLENLIILFVIVIIIILILFFGNFIHDSCKGNKGIPWWPNSGCDCQGFLIHENNGTISIGGGAKYCIGILKEY